MRMENFRNIAPWGKCNQGLDPLWSEILKRDMLLIFSPRDLLITHGSKAFTQITPGRALSLPGQIAHSLLLFNSLKSSLLIEQLKGAAGNLNILPKLHVSETHILGPWIFKDSQLLINCGKRGFRHAVFIDSVVSVFLFYSTSLPWSKNFGQDSRRCQLEVVMLQDLLPCIVCSISRV